MSLAGQVKRRPGLAPTPTLGTASPATPASSPSATPPPGVSPSPTREPEPRTQPRTQPPPPPPPLPLLQQISQLQTPVSVVAHILQTAYGQVGLLASGPVSVSGPVSLASALVSLLSSALAVLAQVSLTSATSAPTLPPAQVASAPPLSLPRRRCKHKNKNHNNYNHHNHHHHHHHHLIFRGSAGADNWDRGPRLRNVAEVDQTGDMAEGD
ncbi:unnamed protein product [Sphagnum balticum]